MKKVIFPIGMMAVMALASCEKQSTIPERFSPTPESNVNLKFLNLSPGSPALNFYGNGAKISAFAAGTGGVETGMSYAGVYPAAGSYVSLPSGTIKFDAIVIPTATTAAGATINSFSRNFEPKKFYTVALVDTFTSATQVVVEDDPSVPDQTKAYIRIANFHGANAYRVDVEKTGSGYAFSKSYASVPAKSALPFDSLGAGQSQVYKVILRNATTNARLDSVINFSPSPTKKYTFFVRGGMAPSGTTRPLISGYINF